MSGSIYLKNKFFIAWGLCVMLFLLSFSYPSLFLAAKICLGLVGIVTIFDYILLLQHAKHIKLVRQVNNKLSLSDTSSIKYTIENNHTSAIHCEIIDELPPQLQKRDFSAAMTLAANDIKKFSYTLRPVTRGQYIFGHLQAFISTPFISFLDRRITFSQDHEVSVIPSVEQMKKYELQVFSKTASLSGIRRVRRIGENDEFEHIRSYAQGDNIKAINWKATSRKNQLMLNQFQDTRSQMVYCIIDKGRSMKMPFNELTLLDYAINSCLAVSNIILKSYDKVGLISYADTLDTFVKSDASPHQIEKIATSLFNEKTNFKESSSELLFYTLRKHVTRRSILLLFTNFENEYDLEHNLKYLRAINKKHLLIVISFINSEIEDATLEPCYTSSDIYFNTIAHKSLVDKQKVIQKLQLNKIQTILTRPQDLSLDAINKYLEIKAKRLR